MWEGHVQASVRRENRSSRNGPIQAGARGILRTVGTSPSLLHGWFFSVGYNMSTPPGQRGPVPDMAEVISAVCPAQARHAGHRALFLVARL